MRVFSLLYDIIKPTYSFWNIGSIQKIRNDGKDLDLGRHLFQNTGP